MSDFLGSFIPYMLMLLAVGYLGYFVLVPFSGWVIRRLPKAWYDKLREAALEFEAKRGKQ